MKLNFLIILLFFASREFCQAQSFVVGESASRGSVQERYVATFVPDYALFNHLGAGLVRHGGEWSLIRLRNIQSLGLDGKLKKKMHVFKRVISEHDAKRILAEAAADSLFLIGQERFDALPETCEGEPAKKRGIAGQVSDASTSTIVEFTPTYKRKIQFYGAESYYRTCYPYQAEFEILSSLLNTVSVLEHYMRKSVNEATPR